jgi:hypothetical protein
LRSGLLEHAVADWRISEFGRSAKRPAPNPAAREQAKKRLTRFCQLVLVGVNCK